MMKKIFTLMMIGSATFASAQKAGSVLTPEHVNRFIQPETRATDTVQPPTPAAACLPNLVYGLLNASGDQVSGTNSYGDLEKAQYFNYPGGGTINGVSVLFGHKNTGSGAGSSTYTVKLYSTTGSSVAPTTLLGTSTPVSYAMVDTSSSSGVTYFPFSSGVTVAADFYASVVVDNGTSADSVAIYMLFDGTNPANTCGNNTAWEKWSDGSWYQMNDATNSWGIDVEFMIFPIITTATGVNEISALTAHNVYPNPATEMLNFSYQLNAATDVKLSLVDVSGKNVYSKKLSAQTFGAYNESVDVSSFAPGIYTYSIQTNGFITTGKVMVK